MTASKRRPKRQRSLLVRIISSPLTTLVLGIFAFLSIVYYKVKIAPPDDDPKKPKVRRSTPTSNLPLLTKAEILGKARDGGPTLTRSFLGMGDIVIQGSKGKRKWGLLLKTKKDVLVVHPWKKSEPLMAWLEVNQGRFALFRTLQPAPVRNTLKSLLTSFQREKPLSSKQQQALQAKWGGAHSPSQWLHVHYKKAGLKHLPNLTGNDTKASQAWLEELIKRSHYSDLK